MLQENKELEQALERIAQDQVQWNKDQKIKKHKIITLFVFAFICLALAIIVYIKDYGYRDFLPGSEHEKDANHTVTESKKNTEEDKHEEITF